jgi:hypothetical protein
MEGVEKRRWAETKKPPNPSNRNRKASLVFLRTLSVEELG